MPKGIKMGTVEDLQNRFPTAKLIKGWKELIEIPRESKTHRLVFSDHSAIIESKEGPHWVHVLSTHAFDYFIRSTKALQKCGFNVILDDWSQHNA